MRNAWGGRSWLRRLGFLPIARSVGTLWALRVGAWLRARHSSGRRVLPSTRRQDGATPSMLDLEGCDVRPGMSHVCARGIHGPFISGGRPIVALETSERADGAWEHLRAVGWRLGGDEAAVALTARAIGWHATLPILGGRCGSPVSLELVMALCGL